MAYPYGNEGWSFLEDVDPTLATQFYRRYGLLGMGLGPGAEWMKQFAAPAQSAYDVASALATAGYAAPGRYETQFLQPWGRGQSPVGGQAGQALRNLYALPSQARREAGLAFEPGTPGAPNVTTSDLRNLILTALRPIIGRSGAGWIAQNIDVLQQEWLAKQPEPTEEGARVPAGSFLDELKARYNLGRWGL